MYNDYTFIYANELKDSMKFNGDTVLNYYIEYPTLNSKTYPMSANRINNVNSRYAMEYQNYVRNVLYKDAVDQYNYSLSQGLTPKILEAKVTYTVAYNTACIVSLYFDEYEYSGGAHGNTTRFSQTWNLQRGEQITIGDIFRCSPGFKSFILAQVRDQIQKNSSMYFDNYDELVEEKFNEKNFYSTPNGIVYYYQQGEIAPYSSGIREFLILYDDCLIDPKNTCFNMNYNYNFNNNNYRRRR